MGPASLAGAAVVLTGIFACHLAVCVQAILARGTYPFGDFLAIWEAARIAAAGHGADVYDFARFGAAQHALGLPGTAALGLPDGAPMPFPYPPGFLVLIWPLGWLPYGGAFTVWIAVGLLLFLWAIGRGFGLGWRAVVLALAAPATAVTLAFGQSGFLLAGLLAGGLALMDRRPLVAGLLFGLLSFKPQFALLLPVALIAAGRWRCIAAAAVAASGLAGTASLVFGASIWASWLASLPGYAAWFDANPRSHFLRVSVRDDLMALGAPGLAFAMQVLVTAILVGLVWVAFRQLPRARAIPLLLGAACLAAPHALVYDLTILTAAVLVFGCGRIRSGGSLALPEAGVLLLTLVFPAGLAWGLHAPVGSGLIALFVAVVAVDGGPARVWAYRPRAKLMRP